MSFFKVKIHTFMYEKNLKGNGTFELNTALQNIDQFKKLISQLLQQTDGPYRKFYIKRIQYVCNLIAEHQQISKEEVQIFLKFKRVKSGELVNFIIDEPSGRCYTQIVHFACPGVKRIIYGAKMSYSQLTIGPFIYDDLSNYVIPSNNFLSYDMSDDEDEENDHNKIREERDMKINGNYPEFIQENQDDAENNCENEYDINIDYDPSIDDNKMEYKEDQDQQPIDDETGYDSEDTVLFNFTHVHFDINEECDHSIEVKEECDENHLELKKENQDEHHIHDENGYDSEDTIPFNFTHVHFDNDSEECDCSSIEVNDECDENHIEVKRDNQNEHHIHDEDGYDSEETVPFCDGHHQENDETALSFESESGFNEYISESSQSESSMDMSEHIHDHDPESSFKYEDQSENSRDNDEHMDDDGTDSSFEYSSDYDEVESVSSMDTNECTDDEETDSSFEYESECEEDQSERRQSARSL